MILFCSIILLGFISTSYADIEIEELRSYNGTNIEYDRGSTYFTFYVRTNEPYGALLWSVDGEWGPNDGILGNGKKKDHYFSFSNLTGRLKGNTYKIEVTAYGLDPNGHLVVPTDNMDTATYNFTVYKPIVTSGYAPTFLEKPRNTGAYGHAEVSAHYFNGTDFVMEGYAFFNNKSDVELSAEAWFRQNEYFISDPVRNILSKSDEKRDTKEKKNYEPGKIDSWTPDSWVVNYPLGRLIGETERFYYDAHTHLQVRTVEAGTQVQDDWEADSGIQEFNKDDNPDDFP